MIIKSIELRNFRNYENLDIHLDEGTNILYGLVRKNHISVLSYRKKKKSTRLICILEKVDQKAWL